MGRASPLPPPSALRRHMEFPWFPRAREQGAGMRPSLPPTPPGAGARMISEGLEIMACGAGPVVQFLEVFYVLFSGQVVLPKDELKDRLSIIVL